MGNFTGALMFKWPFEHNVTPINIVEICPQIENIGLEVSYFTHLKIIYNIMFENNLYPTRIWVDLGGFG